MRTRYLGMILLLAAAPVFAQGERKAEQLARDLDELARIATVMVDGDVCERIVTERAKQYLIKVDPRDQWADADNYDVNHDAFNLTKKQLTRLSRLVPFPADLNLWLPFAPKPGKIHVVIRTGNEMSQFWRFGAMLQDMPSEMKTVLETGKRATVSRPSGMISVLTPVYNSLGDVVGLVEVVGRTLIDAHEGVN
jgi:hypothetical protein